MIIIDIGACVGLFIDYCFQNYEIETIYAFEPLKVNYDFLVEKYAQNPKVKIFHTAVSNFDGEGPLFKKPNPSDLTLFDFVGNVGCSLRKDKSNICQNYFETVLVTTLCSFLKEEKIEHVDILKVDAEGSEYEIIENLLDNNLLSKIDQIYYEDHSRKVPGLQEKRTLVMNRVKTAGFANIFYSQMAHNVVDYRQ
jgi:FkbM family methyltransferase